MENEARNRKIALVCEGGGMRGVFTAGVLQAFMDGGFLASALVGVSAGASNGASYVAGQSGRGYRTNVDYTGDWRYCSLKSYLKTGSVFGMDFVFGEIPETLDPFDYEAFYASSCNYYAGATDVQTGKAVFFSKADVKPGLAVLRASCSMPVFSPMVEIGGRQYLDGGVAAPIPLDFAQTLGCEKLVVVLTQPRGFIKKPQRPRALYHTKYRRYPALVRAMDLRHMAYNHSLEKLWRLEAAGTALVVAPPRPLEVDRFGKNAEKLKAAYTMGQAAGQEGLASLFATEPPSLNRAQGRRPVI